MQKLREKKFLAWSVLRKFKDKINLKIRLYGQSK